ncbi:uncharacterized protein LOC109534700 [Dendroctonus ponderosae]|uniref:Uncharacterized protein n=1 Tax=Dendroctonus ponderosae TaxID=77166 RepID=A0AAR5P574_DENPD|nr:uncharacterized protein LOC109534700 [Dendroctonus ponderosae]KAH1001757.1 hypothetical protein HUJ04_005729 [Dendroctonus ponderosae]
MTCCVIAPLSRKMQNKGLEAIGDATTTEEIHLQDRILRILSNSTEPSDVVFLYFNNQFPEDPPSRSLFEEDALSEASAAANQANGNHNMFPKLVCSRIVDLQSNSLYHVEDMVTRVFLPSEEFAQVVELGPLRRLYWRIWSWCRSKTA